MKERKTIYTTLTKQYLLVIHRVENLKEEVTIHFTFARMIVVLFAAFLVLLAISILVGRGLEAALARKEDALTIDKQIVRLAMQVDSLEVAIAKKDRFIEDFKLLVNGGKPVTLAPPTTPIKNKKQDLQTTMNPIDSAFRKEFEGSANSQTDVSGIKAELKNMKFTLPIFKGVLLKKYDYKTKHYGVDLVAKKSEPILNVANGTVILASWTQDSGYVIAIQHPNNLISFYKHNALLSKKVGDVVRAGEKIAVIGNSGEFTDGPHLHFELWRAGVPLNPEDFIAF